ncbi:uncharacterized protein LOC119682517 [Teleopsis dalmanni]|uniref:uncharacterized protein LOC119682517 n=1 Tax=Teleopsis dalmanni TaxID=139649 RepID=UPI0018CEC9EC|nr:uncharacterized protein LOC119682517 [Teleopsis dalmanni]
MENNEISMLMDVKLDIHDKRPESIQFKTWSKCQVKIEAIKCLPCFLRITFSKMIEDDDDDTDTVEQKHLSVSINVPGVTISLAESRTKQYSYGLFWTHNRRACFIYFALETEASCRRHMKWIKKSIKNLELHRQIFLEQRRNSRGPGRFVTQSALKDKQEMPQHDVENKFLKKDVRASKTSLGPLPNIPDGFDNSSSWSRRVSRVSEIYEEIFEGMQQTDSARSSRRFSRTSIASGIYEEMKPSAANFNAIVEEALELAPPLPPLPPPRKRINTFEAEAQCDVAELVRCNTNPESDLIKKKKYKNMLDNIFGSVRSKRAGSVSESQVSTVDDLKGSTTPDILQRNCVTTTSTLPMYSNEVITVKRSRKLHKTGIDLANSKRNSFSSPDLSKINFLDTFDEEKVADLLLNSFLNSDELDLSTASLDDSAILPNRSRKVEVAKLFTQADKTKADSMVSLNISEKLPNNFNFSACNSSKMNLIGANGAVRLPQIKTNKIIIDDLTGYCFMAPIMKKLNDNTYTHMLAQPLFSTESTSSGYCSSTSTCTTSQDDQYHEPTLKNRENLAVPEESTIYENMQGSLNSTNSNALSLTNSPNLSVDFTKNLYENLLTVKAAQELEQPSTGLSTSTPTDSPLTQTTPEITPVMAEEENYYQTPRKSIISIDDKVPSYYPNSCDTVKMRRQSPLKDTPNSSSSEKSANGLSLRHLVNMKLHRERKENLYISSPQKIIEQRQKPITNISPVTSLKQKSNKTQKPKKTGVHKLSENVYTVKHTSRKLISNNNNDEANEANGLTEEMKEKLQYELLHLAMLQNIDFKFDDGISQAIQTPTTTTCAKQKPDQESENYSQSINKVSDFVKKCVTPTGTNTPTQTAQHCLQQSQESNTKNHTPNRNTEATADIMTQSKVESSSSDLHFSAMRKFASLPRFKKIDLSPLKLKINNVLQRSQHHEF